jgi:hypothetical protein
MRALDPKCLETNFSLLTGISDKQLLCEAPLSRTVLASARIMQNEAKRNFA